MPQLAARGSVRDAILDAADRLLSHYGYRKMTVEDLAREAGIGKGSIYLHFPSKEEVVLSTIDRLVERLVVRLTEIAERPAAPGVKLREMLETRILFRFDHRRHDSRSMDELLSDLRLAFLARREKHFASELAIFASALEEGRARGAFQLEDIQQSARAIIIATNSLLPGSLSPKELGSRKHVATQAAAVAAILVHGLAPRGPAFARHANPSVSGDPS